jgi:ADP-ribose pyrophosphatase
MDTSRPNKKAMLNLDQFLNHSTLAFHGVRFDVRACEVPTSTGGIRPYEAVVHPGAVVILPIYDDTSIIMIRNFRIAVGETLWELPAGTLELNELPEACAYRELAEETGYQAKNMKKLGCFYSSPGISNEVLVAYVAKDLHFIGQKLDDTEVITPEILSWDRVLEMIRNGEIRDSHAISTLMLYQLQKKI